VSGQFGNNAWQSGTLTRNKNEKVTRKKILRSFGTSILLRVHTDLHHTIPLKAIRA